MSDLNATKIIVDTNVWISFLLGKHLSTLKNSLLNAYVNIYFSAELYEEIIKVVNYPRIKKYVPENDFFELISLFRGKIIFTAPNISINECRDPKDNFLLELAVSAKADYLVTGDLDLLALNPFRGVKIVEPGEFEKVLLKIKDDKQHPSEKR